MAQNLSVLILAAGKGTRMRSDKAKVLHSIGGLPLVAFPVHLAQSLNPEKIVVVVGHQGEQVEAALKERFGEGALAFATQTRLLGTGDAVMAAVDELKNAGEEVLILYGDVPLLRRESLDSLFEAKKAAQATLAILSFNVDDPHGYGRIVRDERGRVLEIREHRDCTPEQLAITECNSGIFLVDRDFLIAALDRIEANNDQKEYYLTDIVQVAVQDTLKVVATPIDDPSEVLGANDRAQLAQLEEIWLDRERTKWMKRGVTMLLPKSIAFDYDVIFGSDVTIEPHCYFKGRTSIGAHSTIGAGSYLENYELPPHTIVPPHSLLKGKA